jgi:16S rRNA G1207 methylase RsmC
VRAVVSALRRLEIKERDFLQTSVGELGGPFDAVVMNPPFKQGTDIAHITHALGMVRVGGVLVSLCYDGVKQNKVLRPMADEWEVLPAKSFQDEGTSASVALMVIRKQ